MPPGSTVTISCDIATLVRSWARHERGNSRRQASDSAQKSSDLPLRSLKPQLSPIKNGNKTPAWAASRAS